MLIPKAIAYYRSVRAAPTAQNIPIRPPPAKVSRGLWILFFTAFVFLVKTLPIFSPENIFSITQSRLQIPNDVLFTRVSALRPHGLTRMDDMLRNRLQSLDSRLLYFKYGPTVMAECQFCKAETPDLYLYYAIPSILAPHLLHIVILSLVTSGLFAGKEGAVWRTQATLAGIALALGELYFTISFNPVGNARATRLEDIEPFFWTMRTYRGIMVALVDVALGYLLYLSSTNRAFVSPPTTAEQIDVATRIINATRNKINAAGIIKNAVARDPTLRNRTEGYWVEEAMHMRGIMEQREVIEAVNNAAESRIKMDVISRDAEAYADMTVNTFIAGK